MITKLKIVLWNCSGIRAAAGSTAAKLALFDTMFPHAGFDIAALVETHHKRAADSPPSFRNIVLPILASILLLLRHVLIQG